MAADDITIAVPKLFFGYATGSNLFFPFSVGGSAVLFTGRPTPEALFKRIQQHRATVLINVPKLIKEMVDHPDAQTADLSSLRFATSAGEALPPALYDRWRATFGVELLDGLGTAEMWHVFLTNRPGDVRPGSLGKPVDGFDVRVRDADGNDLPDDEVGRLWVRGDSRAIGYWQDMPKSMEAFRGEWFAAGDLVRRDAHGAFFYVGRGDDAVKVGGKWLLPAEVEGCLMEHPAVLEVAVIGAPDRDGLTKPVAFVVVDDTAGIDLEAELIEHALIQLEPYKRPRRVVITAAMPRTHLGKINRGVLREQAIAALSDH
jgi:acyl-coenzyme A synthetase/AMP-(fatty) acid ligase